MPRVWLQILAVVAVVVVGCGEPKVKPDGTPNLENNPFEAGRLAGRAGLSRDDNPYRNYTTEFQKLRHDSWLTGHNTGVAELKIETRDRQWLREHEGLKTVPTLKKD